MQNKGIVNKQEVIYTEPKFCKSQQQKISKTNQSNAQSREEEIRSKLVKGRAEILERSGLLYE